MVSAESHLTTKAETEMHCQTRQQLGQKCIDKQKGDLAQLGIHTTRRRQHMCRRSTTHLVPAEPGAFMLRVLRLLPAASTAAAAEEAPPLAPGAAAAAMAVVGLPELRGLRKNLCVVTPIPNSLQM
jgi:hypothetical protein